MKLWGGRFSGKTDKFVERFSASLPFDRKLYECDIRGSIAHAKMLAKCGIIEESEAHEIIKGLKEIEKEIKRGVFAFDLADEDIHMAVERALIEKIGPVGGKLHTARSRNDQVALDMRLYIRAQILQIAKEVVFLQREILRTAKENPSVVMPGYTHLQRAQPLLFAHHVLAYFWMLERDFGRLADCWKRTNVTPLGSAALAGTVHPIDREYTARILGFSGVCENSVDAVSDRDFAAEFLATAAIMAVHLSRFAEEIILWCSSEFGFIELSDSFTTGSSIMPQKKNPDVAELIRGKSGRVIGDLMALLVVLKGLPLAYNRDMQEDKENIFDAADTVRDCLKAARGLLETAQVRPEAMLKAAEESFANATDFADYLVGKGLPFREAHEVAGKAVKKCLAEGRKLRDLSLAELRDLNPAVSEDVYEALSVQESVRRRFSRGGTSPERVAEQIKGAEAAVESEEAWLDTAEKAIAGE